ncbi:MAG: threonylcarbamoyl-AMP synthase [Deltaproteobacteria bacterium]|nr:threonylcarbamoyl-AMP synthase [Deltaproteobacteria bacterium]
MTARKTQRLSASRPRDLAEAARLLREGGLVAFPTETVYGLGAHALEPLAVRAIFAAKGRPSHNPLIVHVAEPARAQALVTEWPASAQTLADAFWPGPLTLVLPKTSDVPDEVTAGGPTVALRCPSHPVARELIERVGAPIAAPSANKSEHVSPTTAAHVLADLDGRIDAVLDGGQSGLGIESTVVWLSEGQWRVLRPGSVTQQQLHDVLGVAPRPDLAQSNVSASSGQGTGAERMPPAAHASPGLMKRHYAPAGTVRLLDAATLARESDHLMKTQGSLGVLLCGEEVPVPSGAHGMRLPRDPAGYARGLYAALRDLEELGCAAIAIQAVPEDPSWAAIADRLQRAAG